MIKAIETKYKGYRFRSRLEARWAVFFDALGLEWEYEPEGFDLGDGVYYLPDFKVKYPGRDESEIHYEWFEVKGDLRKISEKECLKIAMFSTHYRITVLDGQVRPTMYNSYWMDDAYIDGVIYLNVNGTINKGHENFKSLAVEIKEDLIFTSKLDDKQRSGFALWCPKGRLWWDEYVNFFTPTTYFGFENSIETACEKARSARFEHGESPSENKKIKKPIYAAGQKVLHSTFGAGVVGGSLDIGKNTEKVFVKFNDAGAKWLLSSFARMECMS